MTKSITNLITLYTIYIYIYYIMVGVGANTSICLRKKNDDVVAKFGTGG